MDRTRESRRSSMASSPNGFPKRRHRTIALRDSSEEGAVEVREASSKRRRNRDRDRDSSNRSKRRRASHSLRDEGEQSTEESIGNEQDDDVHDAGVSRIRSPNTTSSASDQNHRRSFTPAKPPPFKIADQMNGVSIPRKARSASVKRSYESWASVRGGAGTGEELNFRQRSTSPGRQSVEPASPSSSNVSLRKKMKEIGAVPHIRNSFSSNIEIEIAELLFGLKTSKNHESSSQKLEANINHHTSMPCPSQDVEEKKVENYNPSSLVPNNSTEELVRNQNEQPADVDYHDNGSSEVPKQESGEEKVNSGDGLGAASADGRSMSPTAGVSPSCSKLNADKQYSTSARVMSVVPEANTSRVGKFEIDLMAPPPMMLSPERDDMSRDDFPSETKAMEMREGSVMVDNKVERAVKKEKTPEEVEDAEKIAFNVNLDMPKRDSEKPKVERVAHSSAVPLSTTVSGRPSNLSPIGYTPPLQTVVKTDKTTGSSSTPQCVNFVLSQWQPKRCATHYYIARNILNKQFTKMNPPLPATIGCGSQCDTKPNNVNCVPSAESMVIRKQSQKHLPGVDQNGTPEKRFAATSDPSVTAIKSSNNANPTDSTHRMQLVLQQGPHPGSTGNLVHGPALLFPQGQHQASVAAATNQATVVNPPSSASSYNRSHSSVAGSLHTSSTLPAAAAAMSFSYPNFSANDSPYVTVVHNNGYSFPFSTSLGATPVVRGSSPAQTTHILGGPFYSSQIFHPLQHPQQHPHSQVLARPSNLNASTSSSSSSHKQSQGVQVNGNNILTTTTMEQQSQKRQTPLSHPHKHELEKDGENTLSAANRTSCPQTNVHGQNFAMPVQPVNFSFKPAATSDIVGGNSGTFGDKQLQQQQQTLKGGVEVIPSQAFAISFATFNGTSVPSNLNFSSMTQNPLILHSVPEIAWQGYPASSTLRTASQQKTSSVAGEKSGGNSSHQDDEKKTTHGKSSSNGPTTLVFDNSSKNLNFTVSPSNLNWPSHSIASTVITSMPFSGNASSSQQPPQLLQLQKQHGMQQQQPSMATRNKPSSTSTSSATKLANSAPIFSQSLAQCKNSNQASHSKTSGRTTDSHVHHTSILTSSTPQKNFPHEKGRVSQGHMQISFGGNYITSLPPQGQELLNNKQPVCTTAAGTPFNGGNSKPNLEGRKASSSVNTSQSQQTENSSAGSGQKSSPVCGRNVPSILSSCPSHLSELKY